MNIVKSFHHAILAITTASCAFFSPCGFSFNGVETIDHFIINNTLHPVTYHLRMTHMGPCDDSGRLNAGEIKELVCATDDEGSIYGTYLFEFQQYSDDWFLPKTLCFGNKIFEEQAHTRVTWEIGDNCALKITGTK